MTDMSQNNEQINQSTREDAPSLSYGEMIEALEYMSDVFMPQEPFDALVAEGYGAEKGYDEYTMRGDDLAGFCWHFDLLLKAFGINRNIGERHARPVSSDGRASA